MYVVGLASGEAMTQTSSSTSHSALEGVRILDLCGTEGQPCGRYLADLGADVILIEPPGGSPGRSLSPLAAQGRDPERSLYFVNANTNKRSILLDLRSQEGQERFRRLASTADVVLESFSPGYLHTLGLDYDSLTQENPGLVMTSMTPFGQTGPYRDFRGSDIVINALGGLLHGEGEPNKAPLNMPRYQAYQMGGLHAAFGTLMALWWRHRTGLGQWVDVSLHEVMSHQNLILARYFSSQEIGERRAGRGGRGPSQYYPTKDGWVMLALTPPRQWTEFAAWTGDPALMDPKYQLLENRDADFDLLNEKCAAFVAQFDTDELLREGSKRRVTVAPANSPSGFMKDPHAATRGYFQEVTHPVLGRYIAPGAPAVYSATPWEVRRPAPLRGEHTEEVLREIGEHPPSPVPSGSSGRVENDDSMALEGVRVLAFSRVWAAPFGTRFLADYGAEVIKVESPRFPDGRLWDREVNPEIWLQAHANFGEINRNKKSVSLDLHTPAGQELFKRLAAASDVVVENNTPSTMARFGIDYEELKKVKPDIIMVSCPGFGSEGPLKDFVSVGQSLTSYTGLGYLGGELGSAWPLRGKSAYPDFITSANLALAVMAALHHRRRTGEGQYIELAQFQAAASMIGLAYLERSLGAMDPQPWGNRDPNMAPQGIYQCLGHDRWVAISCPDNGSWQRLTRLMGRPGLVMDPNYSTLAARYANHDKVDELITEWTKTMTPHQVMYRCQQAGLPAGVVANGEDLYHDPQLRTAGYIVSVDHPFPGSVEHAGMTVRFTRTPGKVRRPAPTPGQHTNDLLTSLLGLSDAEIKGYAATGALA